LNALQDERDDEILAAALGPESHFCKLPGLKDSSAAAVVLRHPRSTEIAAVVCCTPYRRVHRLDAELHETTSMFNDALVLTFPLLLAPKAMRNLLLQSAKTALHKRPGESVFGFVRVASIAFA
jgi:hypothetical protein